MSKYKSDFDKLRKSIRKIQRDADRKSLVGGTDSMVSNLLIKVKKTSELIKKISYRILEMILRCLQNTKESSYIIGTN